MDTLVEDPYVRRAPTFFGLELEELERRKRPGVWPAFERGEIDEATLFEQYFEQPPGGFDPSDFKAFMRRGYRWVEGMQELLGELRDRGVPMHALSNYPVWYRMIEDELELSRYLEWTFVSCRTGVRKPDPAAFRGPVDRLGGPPERFLFVDDREENCEAAASLGLRTHHFTGSGTLRRTLEEEDVL